MVVAVGVITWLAVADDGSGSSTGATPAASTMPGQIGPRTAAGAPQLGDQAPDFALPALDGSGTVRLSDFAGTPVVLNFWASWCVPCRDEFPLLRTADRAADGRYQIVGVDTRDGIRSDGRDFAKEQHAQWPNGYDGDEAVRRAYGVNGQPQTLFIDGDGTIVARVAGPLTEASLAANLSKITR